MAKLSNTPADRFPKQGQLSKQELSPGAKTLKDEHLRIGQAADVGPAPPSRVYSRDYSKRDVDGDQHDDTLSVYLGNPLGL
jgi:hypothetical protein